MISTESDKNPSFLAFFRSASSKAKGIQPKAYFFAPFFAILDRCATHLMGMQWRGARGLRERASARKKKKWRRWRSNKLVNSKSKMVFSLNKASVGRNVGCDVACEAEATSPLTGGNFKKLLCCHMQRLVIRLKRIYNF
jgi:hypothetical protein